MSTCEMLTVIRDARTEERSAARTRTICWRTTCEACWRCPGESVAGRTAPARHRPTAAGSTRCRGPLPKTDQADPPAQSARRAAGRQLAVQTPPVQSPPVQAPATPQPPVRQMAKPPRPASPASPGRIQPAPRPQVVTPRPQLSNWAQVATAADRATDADRRADRFSVEVHKKWAISLACASFVIIGIVMALRFPRGGIGLVIGGGLLVFSVHYVGLTAGESLADRGLMSPWLAMWAAEHRPHGRRPYRAHPGEPRIRLDPRRRLPGDARRRAPPRPAAPAPACPAGETR